MRYTLLLLWLLPSLSVFANSDQWPPPSVTHGLNYLYQRVEQLSIEQLTFYTALDPVTEGVGGVTPGTDLSGLTYGEILERMLYPELFGTLTAPSTTFTMSPDSSLHEIGAQVTLTFTRSFDRGSISPPYESASPYRSGDLDTWQYDHVNVDPSWEISNDTLVLTNYPVAAGGQTWRVRAHHLAGVQPQGSMGSNFDDPLAAGFVPVAYIARTLTGVYPFFATTVDVNTLTKQGLAAHGSTITRTMASEIGQEERVRLEVADDWGTVPVVQVFNPVTDQWDTIDDTEVTTTTRDIQGNTVNYNTITHSGPRAGSRQYRFVF